MKQRRYSISMMHNPQPEQLMDTGYKLSLPSITRKPGQFEPNATGSGGSPIADSTFQAEKTGGMFGVGK